MTGVYRILPSLPDFEILLFGYSALTAARCRWSTLPVERHIPQEVHRRADKTMLSSSGPSMLPFERVCLSRWLRDHGGFDNAYYSVPEYTVHYRDPSHGIAPWSGRPTMGLPLSLEGVGAVLGLGEAEAHRRQRAHQILLPALCCRQRQMAVAPETGRSMRRTSGSCFKRYNVRDVEAEMAIQEKLAKFPVPRHGLGAVSTSIRKSTTVVSALDMELVQQAIAYGRPLPCRS